MRMGGTNVPNLPFGDRAGLVRAKHTRPALSTLNHTGVTLLSHSVRAWAVRMPQWAQTPTRVAVRCGHTGRHRVHSASVWSACSLHFCTVYRLRFSLGCDLACWRPKPLSLRRDPDNAEQSATPFRCSGRHMPLVVLTCFCRRSSRHSPSAIVRRRISCTSALVRRPNTKLPTAE